jgi:alpha-beta hydrolase superfamily lysophospholipase
VRVIVKRVVVVVLIAMGAVLVGCGGSASTSGGTAEGLGTSVGHPVSAGTVVTFTTEDGVTLSGRLFGRQNSGAAGVVLAHMYPADQTSWYDYARRLADEGYVALAFDFRGYGESGGSKQIGQIDRDVAAALGEIQARGVTRVALVGASMGGTAALMVAARQPVQGVITLSAPVEFEGLSAKDAVTKVLAPKLFIGAEDDAGGPAARELGAMAQEPKEVAVFPGSDHGTDLLRGAQRDAVLARMQGFLARNVLGNAP